jgi:hypothetical protein
MKKGGHWFKKVVGLQTAEWSLAQFEFIGLYNFNVLSMMILAYTTSD